MHSPQALDTLFKALVGARLHRFDIAACAKAASGTGDDDRTDFAIAAQALQHLAQGLQHRRGERVEPVRAIERQPGDSVFNPFQQVRHLQVLLAATGIDRSGRMLSGKTLCRRKMSHGQG